jgi:hypothetical protein
MVVLHKLGMEHHRYWCIFNLLGRMPELGLQALILYCLKNEYTSGIFGRSVGMELRFWLPFGLHEPLAAQTPLCSSKKLSIHLISLLLYAVGLTKRLQTASRVTKLSVLFKHLSFLHTGVSFIKSVRAGSLQISLRNETNSWMRDNEL